MKSKSTFYRSCGTFCAGRPLKRAGFDRYERSKRSKLHAAAGTLGYLLALVTPANEADHEQVLDGLLAAIKVSSF